MIDFLLNPSVWFPLAIAVATAAVAASRRWLDAGAAMNRFYGCVVGVMALGHLVAITLKLVLGTLSPTTSGFAIPLGFVLGVPAWWLAVRPANDRLTLVLNGWLAGSLVALGTSAALAVPAALNVGYGFRRTRALVMATVVVYLAMFTASFFVRVG
jgi:hypothetical protein